jgi:hypothetical protein
MNKLMTAIALAIALPSIAQAAETPAPAPKADCCEKMKEKCCCKDMESHKGEHGKSDTSEHQDHAGH